VSFVDFPPTLLSLAGVKVPKHFQGKAFLGGQAAPPRRYIHGFRDRMDERYDLLRCVRDERFKYIRNFMPHLPWFHHQHVSYMYEMPTMRAWQRLAGEGKLSGPAAVFMAPRKPIEELYDTQADPHEVRNLAADPAHRETLERLRAECRRWMLEIADLGLLPEDDLRARFGDEPPYDAVRRDPSRYPIERILAAADLANRIDPGALPRLIALLDDEDPAICYWGAVGINALGGAARPAAAEIEAKIGGQPPAARLQLAEALANLGKLDRALPILGAGLAGEDEWVRLQAANIIDRLDDRADPLRETIRGARDDKNQYVRRVIDHILEEVQK
jgi:uncharacterized sulfatase